MYYSSYYNPSSYSNYYGYPSYGYGGSSSYYNHSAYQNSYYSPWGYGYNAGSSTNYGYSRWGRYSQDEQLADDSFNQMALTDNSGEEVIAAQVDSSFDNSYQQLTL
jgi:hypothetical protein